MVIKIYKNKQQVSCDNCGEGFECETWEEVLEIMREENWKKRLIDGEYNHFCSECSEVIK